MELIIFLCIISTTKQDYYCDIIHSLPIGSQLAKIFFNIADKYLDFSQEDKSKTNENLVGHDSLR